jgi:hypothetical protein
MSRSVKLTSERRVCAIARCLARNLMPECVALLVPSMAVVRLLGKSVRVCCCSRAVVVFVVGSEGLVWSIKMSKGHVIDKQRFIDSVEHDAAPCIRK